MEYWSKSFGDCSCQMWDKSLCCFSSAILILYVILVIQSLSRSFFSVSILKFHRLVHSLAIMLFQQQKYSCIGQSIIGQNPSTSSLKASMLTCHTKLMTLLLTSLWPHLTCSPSANPEQWWWSESRDQRRMTEERKWRRPAMEVNNLSLFSGCKEPRQSVSALGQVSRTCPFVLKLRGDGQQ